MEKYTYIRKTITWENRRYEVRRKTEQEACDKLAEMVASSPKRVWASMMRSITAILAPPLGH